MFHAMICILCRGFSTSVSLLPWIAVLGASLYSPQVSWSAISPSFGLAGDLLLDQHAVYNGWVEVYVLLSQSGASTPHCKWSVFYSEPFNITSQN